MTEHRSFWTAVGITLFTIGLGGAISFQIAADHAPPADRHGYWSSWLSAACVVLVGVGVVALGWVLKGIFRMRAVRLGLSRWAEGGAGLFQSLRVIGDDDAQVPELRKQAVVWIFETGEWIGKWLPEFEGHFANVAGLLNREQWQLTTDRNVVLVSLETHLERVGEITLKV